MGSRHKNIFNNMSAVKTETDETENKNECAESEDNEPTDLCNGEQVRKKKKRKKKKKANQDEERTDLTNEDNSQGVTKMLDEIHLNDDDIEDGADDGNEDTTAK